jgi:hypothetical protein
MIREGKNNDQKLQVKNKGGRPKKHIKRDQQLALMCTLLERKIIEHKARLANLCLSEFLRELAMGSQENRKIKVLPKEVLHLTATLHHMAANLNQLSKKNNREEPFSEEEKTKLGLLAKEITNVAENIKCFLK